MELFYATTTITLGNGKKTPFWHAPWLNGTRPIDIAPLIYESSKRKNWKVAQALDREAWIDKIDLQCGFTMDHFLQFVDLWTLLDTILLNPDSNDEITWKLTQDGNYTTKSAYEMQWFGLIYSPLDNMVWKAWAPPKTKFFAWLVNKNRIWTADRLAKRGWPNCGLCPLCKQCTETVDHLFVNCRYTTRLPSYNGWQSMWDINITMAPTSPSRNGGSLWRESMQQTARPWPPSPFLSRGKFGMSVMIGSSIIRVPPCM
jgi:hypothetical protein